MGIKWIWCLSVLHLGCCGLSSTSGGKYDAQFIQIFYHSGLLDELDTFHGTYQKDLIPGTATTPMWLTTREQEILQTNIEQIKFFSFPDTIHRPPNIVVAPDLGPQVLRIKYKNQDKTVVWYDPIDSQS